MFIILDKKDYKFPPVNLADEDGVLAVGGDLHPERLLSAYRSGIFPWYNEGEPIVWYAPKYRMVLKPSEVYISKSMRKIIKAQTFTVTYNTAFEAVITSCKTIRRNRQFGTWITDDLERAMVQLHKMGYAKSVEVWQNDELVGGLFGMDLGDMFTGDSMFSKVSNASKVAFISLCQKLEAESYRLLDCQVYNDHLNSLGAYEIPRQEFMSYMDS